MTPGELGSSGMASSAPVHPNDSARGWRALGPSGRSLRPAPGPRGYLAQRLLSIDPTTKSLADHSISELPSLVAPRDVLVVNDAATLPASLFVVDRPIELRLIARAGPSSWRALAFGAGNYRTPTERRPEPPRLDVGTRLDFSLASSAATGGLTATVESIDPRSPRLLVLRFDRSGAALMRALYEHGRPIQYAHVDRPLDLWDVQSAFASRPWAIEAPSAGLALTWSVIGQLREDGTEVVSLTHAAGLSSTGEDALDDRLPFSESYEISVRTADVVAAARRRGGRVVAVGTTVVRALESSAAAFGELRPGRGEATLVIDARHALGVVDGVLTGMHEPGTSHFSLLEAFASKSLLSRALRHARRRGYLRHEFGDLCLVLRRAA
jgi:S-adenosylmethionine:tRNA ribosyltransferase-isomerase